MQMDDVAAFDVSQQPTAGPNALEHGRAKRVERGIDASV